MRLCPPQAAAPVHAEEYGALQREVQRALAARDWQQAVAAANKALALGSERGERGDAARLAAQCRAGLVMGRARARLGLKQFSAAVHDADILLLGHPSWPVHSPSPQSRHSRSSVRSSPGVCAPRKPAFALGVCRCPELHSLQDPAVSASSYPSGIVRSMCLSLRRLRCSCRLTATAVALQATSPVLPGGGAAGPG